MADGFRRVDLHMHTAVSDGTDTPQELIEKVRNAGLSVFSVTDHDAVKAGKIIRPLLKNTDPLFITGAEFSCRDENGKYHILGYGYDPDSAAVTGLVGRVHSLRMQKVIARLDFIREEFGFVFPQDEIDRLLSLDNPGKPHIGNLMVKYGYAQNKEQAINDFINKKRFKSGYIGPAEAIEAIQKGGGVPVLAHPCYGSGNELIVGDELDTRVKRLKEYGLKGVECYYSGFTSKLRSQVLAVAEKYGLYVTAGSDYHGANKLVKLGDTGLYDAPEYPEGLRRFLELFDNAKERPKP